MCDHYKRNCKIVAPCCNEVYPCRICHDEKYEFLDIKIKHKINRFEIKEVICLTCDLRQEVSNECKECKTVFGKYFCDICNLFDNVDKGQYHCSLCGFCRIGYQNNFIHCTNCNMCIGKNLYDSHKCVSIANSLCPICMADLYTSTLKIIPCCKQCGQYLHIDCLTEYLKTNYKCPTCSKSIVKMDMINKYIDLEIENTEMPDEYKDLMVEILCNDCHNKDSVKFHIIGLKCGSCGSYNTRKI